MLKRTIVAALLVVGLAGCSLIPKKVELFQDKVSKLPVPTSREKETQRQAAALASKKADQTLTAALKTDAPAEVIEPAKDTSLLTHAVSTSLGPPAKPWNEDLSNAVQVLATKLDSSVAALNNRLDEFRADNDKNAGKKIEGTGLFQIPYVVWAGGTVLLIFVIFSVGRVALKVLATINPPVAIGMSAAQVAAGTLRKGFTQVVAAGENFKDELVKVATSGDSDLTEKHVEQVLALFRKHQQSAQDHDVQETVKKLTA